MKRLIDTDQWLDPWWIALPSKYKCFWRYLCDKCDDAGFWEPDMDLASFMVDAPMDRTKALELFSGRVEVLSDGKWWLPKFTASQCSNEIEDSPQS